MGMKPFAFAQKHGFVPESLRRWLNGQREPKIEHIRKLADALNCTVEDISSWAHEVDKSKLAQYERELEEITGLWSRLTAEQRSAVMQLVRSMANGAKSEQ